MYTQFKLKALPFISTLDMSFFLRLAFFIGVTAVCVHLTNFLKSDMVSLQGEEVNSPNKYSKTFG
jgi:hypothetical protein